MKYVPVLSSTGQRLMPCHAARARHLVHQGRAIRRFDRGLFYIKLLDREAGEIQPMVVRIDPGTKKEAYSIKSERHTFLNIQADAVMWVSQAEDTSHRAAALSSAPASHAATCQRRRAPTLRRKLELRS